MGNSVSHCEPSAAEHEAEVNTPLEEDEAPDAAATDITVATSPHDSRFPATNQSRHCYTKYNEFHRCVAQKGGEEAECEVYRKAYRTLCPAEWVEKWNTQREEGTWAGKY